MLSETTYHRLRDELVSMVLLKELKEGSAEASAGLSQFSQKYCGEIESDVRLKADVYRTSASIALLRGNWNTALDATLAVLRLYGSSSHRDPISVCLAAIDLVRLSVLTKTEPIKCINVLNQLDLFLVMAETPYGVAVLSTFIELIPCVNNVPEVCEFAAELCKLADLQSAPPSKELVDSLLIALQVEYVPWSANGGWPTTFPC